MLELKNYVDGKWTDAQSGAREEIFGPVMSVIPFSDVDEAVRVANDNDYGLAAAVWTKDITKAITTAKALRAGIVWINDTQPAPTEAPWGGYKQSGIGPELGRAGRGRLPRAEAHLHQLVGVGAETPQRVTRPRRLQAGARGCLRPRRTPRLRAARWPPATATKPARPKATRTAWRPRRGPDRRRRSTGRG